MAKGILFGVHVVQEGVLFLSAVIQNFDEEMSTEDLQHWLLDTQMPHKDRKVLEGMKLSDYGPSYRRFILC